MITFIYSTCRKNPLFEWFVDSLFVQANECGFDITKIQIVIVDFELQNDSTRINSFKEIINNRFEYSHVEPKPSAYQGKHRVTNCDFFAAGNARNTGVCYAKHGYIVFVDDLSILGPNSLLTIIECAKRNIVVGFAYKKILDMEVKDGVLVSHGRIVGEDHRLFLEPVEEYRLIDGPQLYGYNACPLEAVLKVNGYDELTNMVGQEDCNYGGRLSKSGYPIYYARNVMFFESENHGHIDNIFRKREIEIAEETYRQIMNNYDITSRWYDGNSYNIGHIVNDILTKDTWWTHGNDFNLKELRNKILEGGQFSCEFSQDAKTIDGIFLRDL
jgi:hypothetical protein